MMKQSWRKKKKTLDFTFIFCFLSCAYQVELLVDDEKKNANEARLIDFLLPGVFQFEPGLLVCHTQL